MRSHVLIGLFFAALFPLGVVASEVSADSSLESSIERFTHLPGMRGVSFSPDGTKVVSLRPIRGNYQAVVTDFVTGKSQVVMASDPDKFLINWCRFANATRVICSYRAYVVMQAGDISGAPRRYVDGRTTVTRLVAVDADGKNALQLVPKAISDAGQDLEWNATSQDTVISYLVDKPKYILLQIARDHPEWPSVYRVNIYNNKIRRVRRHHAGIRRWYADPKGQFKYAVGFDDGMAVAYSLLGKNLRRVSTPDIGGLSPPRVMGLAADGVSTWVIANNGSNTRGVHRIDIETGKVAQTLFAPADYDVAGLWLHPRTRVPLFATYWDTALRYKFFDSELEQIYHEVAEVLRARGSRVSIESYSLALNQFVFYVEGGASGAGMYLYNPQGKNLMQLAAWGEGIATNFKAVSYTARDGLQIPAYVALPGPEEAGPYPTVVYPHGGPYVRVGPEQWFETQYLVAAGYAVLMPNYRGSAGYGDEFMQAGFDEWGLKMQDDLTDGLDWMVRTGLADPRRVCIVGGSYGGYAALVASFKTPEKYQCAVSFAGVSDLERLGHQWRNFRFGDLAIARVQSGKLRREYSPIERVRDIKLPLLIVHGDVDRSVMIEQSRLLVAKLEEAGVPHRYIEQRNADHFFSLQAHRREYLQALDEFLSEHLAP